MPTYLYQTALPGVDEPPFEVEHPMSQPPLTEHPVTGEPLRRILHAPNIGTRYSERKIREHTETSKVAKAGFTKYVRDKQTGQYHKEAGAAGPDVLQRPTDGPGIDDFTGSPSGYE